MTHRKRLTGRIRVALAEYEAAVMDFERARDLYQSLNYGSREARTLVWLAEDEEVLEGVVAGPCVLLPLGQELDEGCPLGDGSFASGDLLGGDD